MPNVHRWTGAAGDNTLTTVGNYYNETLAATTVSFGAGDTIYYTSLLADIDTGLDFGATNLEAVYFSANKNLGTSSTSASFNISNSATSKFVYSGTGSFCNLQSRTGGAITLVQCLNSQGKIRLASNGTTITNVQVGANATVELDATALVTNLYMGGGSVLAAASGTAFTVVDMTAGSLSTARNIATGRILGNQCLCQLTGSAAVTTSVTVTGGARYNHQSTGTITAGTVGAGSKVDAVGNTRGFTVTNFTRYPNAYLFDNESVSVTYTNPVVKYGYV